MAGTSSNNRSGAASGARDHARQAGEQVKVAGAQLKLAAGHLKPISKSMGAAAKRAVNRGRSWVARQLHRSGHSLHDDVARKVADRLSSAADRIKPPEDQNGS